MAGEKVFVGPKLRELRHGRNLTQAEMAAELGVSASYINLIERNQRPASLKFLINLSDTFGLNWRELFNNEIGIAISDLRQITKDPAFGEKSADIEELRSALESAPNLIKGLVNIYNAYRSYGEKLAEQNDFISSSSRSELGTEQSVHDFFRVNNNYFDDIEMAAEEIRQQAIPNRDELYSALRNYISNKLSIKVHKVRDEVLGSSVRYYNRDKRELFLSDRLDHQNQIFQLAHVIALVGYGDVLNAQLPSSVLNHGNSAARYRIELANYFAAAVIMPYDEFHLEAQNAKYDIERLAAFFAVSYEQVCHRMTTLQKPGNRGIPFFFLRIDRGGNVSKRFNVTPIQLAPFWWRLSQA